MAKTLCILSACVLVLMGCTDPQASCLKKALAAVENVKAATYYERVRSWAPGDTLFMENLYYKQEWDNPADTTLGASFLWWDAADTTRLLSCYDGRVLIYLDPDDRQARMDDFTTRHLPFRPVQPPFFSYVRSILDYVLTTTDSIDVQWPEDMDDTSDCYHLSLTIQEDTQVEFFGRGTHMPKNPFTQADPTSRYDLWIGKADYLPRKVRRQMSHQTSEHCCIPVRISTEAERPPRAEEYVPAGYKVRYRGEPEAVPSVNPLLGQQAPAWVLTDAWGKSLSLSDLKARAVVLAFTGIGCGPCLAAVPVLESLPDRFAPGDCEVVSIECWGHRAHSLRVYAERNGITHPFLVGTEDVINDYLGGRRGVPVFFVLDGQRVVRHVFMGFNPEEGGESIHSAVRDVLAGS